jgi:8-oxo-dGTP pyrophosphatase MutT (NUDIX family)
VSEASGGSAAIRKATAVVTRGDGTAREVLVFAHARTGLQLPAGTVKESETFEAAAIRELAEETGLIDATLQAELGFLDEISEGGNPFHRHIFHFEPAGPVEERWDHPCDCGDEITLFWIPFETGRLDHRQQPWLDLARSTLLGQA